MVKGDWGQWGGPLGAAVLSAPSCALCSVLGGSAGCSREMGQGGAGGGTRWGGGGPRGLAAILHKAAFSCTLLHPQSCTCLQSCAAVCAGFCTILSWAFARSVLRASAYICVHLLHSPARSFAVNPARSRIFAARFHSFPALHAPPHLCTPQSVTPPSPSIPSL